jgi:hypothetical protein
VKLGQARVDPFRTAATPTDPYSPFSYSGDQLLNPYTETVSSRFYPDRMQIIIYSGTILVHFHLHQIRFVTRLCVTVAYKAVKPVPPNCRLVDKIKEKKTEAL